MLVADFGLDGLVDVQALAHLETLFDDTAQLMAEDPSFMKSLVPTLLNGVDDDFVRQAGNARVAAHQHEVQTGPQYADVTAIKAGMNEPAEELPNVWQYLASNKM